jgi:hypothetical protein
LKAREDGRKSHPKQKTTRRRESAQVRAEKSAESSEIAQAGRNRPHFYKQLLSLGRSQSQQAARQKRTTTMNQTQYPNAFTEGKGKLRLVCWVAITGIGYWEADVIEADAETQRVTIQRRGRPFPVIVQFSAVQNVALKWNDGTIEHNFGAPKADKPETVEYIRGWTDANRAQS